MNAKISLRDDIRRLVIPQNMVYIDLRNHVSKVFEVKHQHFLLQYEDDERDYVTLTNDEEWKEAMEMAAIHQRLKLRILLDNESPVHNIGLSRSEHVNIGVTSMMKSIPPEKLQQMISTVLTSPDMQKMFQQTLLSTLPHISNKSGADAKSNNVVAPKTNSMNNNQSNSSNKVADKPASHANEGMYPPPPMMSNNNAGMYPPTQSFHQPSPVHSNGQQRLPYPQPSVAAQGMYPVVPQLSAYSAYGSSLYASTTSYSRPDDEKRPSASFVRDIACFEGTKIQPKTLFFKTWRIQNDGKHPWPQGTKLVWEGGDSFGYKVESEILQVTPGNYVDATVHLESPNIPQRYNSCWRLCANGEKFGPRVWVDIFVVDPEHRYPALQEVSKTNSAPATPSKLPSAHHQNVPEVRKMELLNSGGSVEDNGSVMQSISISDSKTGKSLENGLQQLEDMGFKDREVNTKLMIVHNGEVLQVVQALLTQEIVKE